MKGQVIRCVVGLLLLMPSANAQESFTLEHVMSAPFPTELRAAPAKRRVAWVFNAQGLRNLWVAELSADGHYKAQQITSFPEDDGQDLGQLSWTPDAATLVYTRGGDFEFLDRPYPNPQSSPQGVGQGVWALSLETSESRLLGEGHSPAVSPKGDNVAFLFKGQVWLVKLNATGKAEQLIHAGGEADSLRWSPDGSKLAFVSRRGDHAFVGVYDLGSKSLVYLDPSVDFDREPVWSPNGQQLAFIRIPGAKGQLPFNPRREGQPWSIRIADASTGKGREVWRAEVGSGSMFHDIEAENQLFWSADNQTIFPWERDGWVHLYAVSTSGGPAKLLTPGNFEVEYASFSANREEVVFSSNQDDIDRRHVWKVSLPGNPPAAVTSGNGIETFPVIASDNRTIFLLHSDARFPMRPAVIASKGEIRDLAPDTLSSDFPLNSLVTPRQVIFPAADGMQIHGQLFLPANINDGKRHPAIVFFHGGSRRQMLLGWHYMFYYNNAYALNQFLASRGYVVLSVNYRSGIGYGLNFREALNYGARGASEFKDVQGAGLYLQTRADVDSHRIGLWGGSYGGYLTALGLARASDMFTAGVDLHGVHDWNAVISNFMPSYKPTERAEAARLAWESSPLSSMATWRSPVLLIQGDDDRNVPFSETVDLAEALRKQGVEFEQLIFPDDVHDFLLHRNWLAAYRAACDFFDRHFNNPGN